MRRRILFLVRTYCEEVKQLFSNWSVQPSSSRKWLYDDFIRACKSDGNWNETDVIWSPAVHDQQAARINIKTPGSHNLIEVNSPGWAVDRGYTGNGTSSYLNTNYNPGAGGYKFSQNNASFGVYITTAHAVNNVIDIGGGAGIPNLINVNNGSNVFSARCNSLTSATTLTGGADPRGLFSTSRTDATNYITVKNGSTIETVSQASTAVTNYSFYLLAGNFAGVAGSFSPRQVAFGYAGSGNINHFRMYNRIQTLLSGIGAAV